MKNILLILGLLMAMPLGSYAQKKSIRKFYRQYKKAEGTRNFIIPGFLIRFGTGLARDMVKSDEQYEMLRLARKIRQARILFSEDYNPVKKKDYKKLVDNVRQTAYEDLINVRSEDTDVQIMIDEDGEKIKGLFILVHESDTFMMLHLKTKLKYDDINRLLKLMQDELPIVKDPPLEEPEIPQV